MYYTLFDEDPFFEYEYMESLVEDYISEKQRFFQDETTQEVFKSDRFGREDLLTQLTVAHMEARKRKCDTEDEMNFEFNLGENISLLADDVLDRRYEPSRGIAFIVKEPVIREVFAAPYRDRIIHHLLYNLSYEWWDRRFIGSSFSCRKGKGNITGWKRLQKDLKSMSRGGKVDCYIFKMDISGYFMSLRRDLLFEAVREGLEVQFARAPRIKSLATFLWHEVIFDDPTEGVILRGKPSDWKPLAMNKSLFHQKKGQGIVIGNLTSQLLSNIFLDEFDRFVKVELGYKCYGRYVDDAYIIIPKDKMRQLKKDLKRIKKFLGSKGLRLHPKKCQIIPMKNGVEFVGAKVFADRVLPSNRIIKNMRKEVHEIIYEGKEDMTPFESYLGLLKHYRAKGLVYEALEKLEEAAREEAAFRVDEEF